jgi:hypothetical protein
MHAPEAEHARQRRRKACLRRRPSRARWSGTPAALHPAPFARRRAARENAECNGGAIPGDLNGGCRIRAPAQRTRKKSGAIPAWSIMQTRGDLICAQETGSRVHRRARRILGNPARAASLSLRSGPTGGCLLAPEKERRVRARIFASTRMPAGRVAQQNRTERNTDISSSCHRRRTAIRTSRQSASRTVLGSEGGAHMMQDTEWV